jgi:hypothetical protein
MFGPMRVIPLFLPGLALTIVLAIALARPVGHWLGVRPWIASLLISGFGIIVAATLTPTAGAAFDGVNSDGVCDLSRVGFASLRELTRPTEASLNILLFIPLGIAVGLLPRSRRTSVVTAVALLLTFLVEATQLLVPALGRGCQTADLVDNLIGFSIGLVVGVIARLAASRRDQGLPGA